MLEFGRSLLFNLANASVTLVIGVVCLPVLALPRRFTMRVARFWARTILWLLRTVVGLDYELRGRDRLPKGPAIYALKHQSAWETITFIVEVPEFAGVFKRELLWIPVYGWYAARVGMIPVDRSARGSALRAMIRRTRQSVEQGNSIMIMPEGTRVPPGKTGTYHPGVAALYKALGIPVVPVALNSGLYWRRRGFRKHPGTVIMEFLEPIGPGLDRAAFMARLEDSIESASEVLRREGLKRDFDGSSDPTAE